MKRWGWMCVVVACGGPSEVVEAPPTPDQIEVEAEGAKDEAGEVRVPTPMETWRAAKSLGIDAEVAKVVPEWTFTFAKDDAERVAIRTGVLLSDLVFSADSKPPEVLVANLAQVHQGFETLGAGPDALAVVDDLKTRVEAGALSGQALVAELDALAGRGTGELKLPNGERVTPLVRAGVWLEGAYVVSEAIKRKGDPGPAESVLRQPDVVAYFKTYADHEAKDAVDPEVKAVIDSTLATLHEVARQEAAYSMEDVSKVVTAVDALMLEL